MFIQGILVFRWFHNVLLVSLSKSTKPLLRKQLSNACMWSVIQSKAFQNSLFSWLLTIFTTKGHYIIENMLLHCCLIRAGGKIFLGLTLVLLHLNYLLLVSLSWKSVEAWFVSRWSLKDLIKVTFTISFFFWKKLRKVNAGIMAVCRKKKLKLCGICGMNFAKKHQLHGNVLSRDHQKSILLSKKGDLPFLKSEMNFIKNKCFVLIVQPQVSVNSCIQNLIIISNYCLFL